MRTTIDGAGRIVVPKPIRDALGLAAGREIDVAHVDGRIEIELAPVLVEVETGDGLPRLRPLRAVPDLTDEQVRSTVESTRR